MQIIITDILTYMEGLPVGVQGNVMGRVVGPVAEKDESVSFGEHYGVKVRANGRNIAMPHVASVSTPCCCKPCSVTSEVQHKNVASVSKTHPALLGPRARIIYGLHGDA